MNRLFQGDSDSEKQVKMLALANSGDGDPFKTTVISILLDLQSDIKTMAIRLETIEAEFPEAHRKFLDEMVADSHEKNAVWLEVKKKLASGGAWAIAVAVGLALWQYIKEHVR